MATEYNDNPTFAYFGTQGSKGQPFNPDNFLIAGGCISLGEGSYLYRTFDNTIGNIEIVFQASQTPNLGDKVVNAVLVPRAEVANPARNVFQNEWPEPIINNDPGFQNDKIRNRNREVWPVLPPQ